MSERWSMIWPLRTTRHTSQLPSTISTLCFVFDMRAHAGSWIMFRPFKENRSPFIRGETMSCDDAEDGDSELEDYSTHAIKEALSRSNSELEELERSEESMAELRALACEAHLEDSQFDGPMDEDPYKEAAPAAPSKESSTEPARPSSKVEVNKEALTQLLAMVKTKLSVKELLASNPFQCMVLEVLGGFS